MLVFKRPATDITTFSHKFAVDPKLKWSFASDGDIHCAVFGGFDQTVQIGNGGTCGCVKIAGFKVILTDADLLRFLSCIGGIGRQDQGIAGEKRGFVKIDVIDICKTVQMIIADRVFPRNSCGKTLSAIII